MGHGWLKYKESQEFGFCPFFMRVAVQRPLKLLAHIQPVDRKWNLRLRL
jgi:hypothetical protein